VAPDIEQWRNGLHGSGDRRHVVSDWRPSSDAAAAGRRADLLDRARAYFKAQDVLAVDTPALGRYAGSDPNIDSLAARSKFSNDYFLHTSPEFCMKRLLAAGYPDIYSICRVYRDGESGKRHVPEFTMVEWYRLGFDLGSIIDDTTAFIATCLDEPALADSVAVLDYGEAFRMYAGIDAFAVGIDDLAACASADDRLRRELADDRDTWLDLLMSTVVTPQFPGERLTVVQHYPASQAALARLCPDDDRVADRFEVFHGAMELANGYVELTDAQEQRQRIDRDLEKRQQLGRDVYPWDRTLIAALKHGLPECAGVALGLERLQMVMDRTDDIRNVMAFAYED
jgi:lysyl-tRNA synthetase class 2